MQKCSRAWGGIISFRLLDASTGPRALCKHKFQRRLFEERFFIGRRGERRAGKNP